MLPMRQEQAEPLPVPSAAIFGFRDRVSEGDKSVAGD
jgi:hypothetical protein